MGISGRTKMHKGRHAADRVDDEGADAERRGQGRGAGRDQPRRFRTAAEGLGSGSQIEEPGLISAVRSVVNSAAIRQEPGGGLATRWFSRQAPIHDRSIRSTFPQIRGQCYALGVLTERLRSGGNCKSGGRVMALIQWNDSLSVNVAEVDKQHQKLVQMINDLHEAMRQGKGNAVLGPLVNGLIDYTGTHFKTEERYFARFAYPETEAHKKLHADFVAKVADFQKKFAANATGLSVDVMSFLSNWLQGHIKGEDKKYTACFNANGVK
jgi:hemerythrin